MLVNFLVVLPANSTLVLHTDTVFSSKSFLVVDLGLVLLNLLYVIPAKSRLVLPVRLNTKLAPEAILISWWRTGGFRQAHDNWTVETYTNLDLTCRAGVQVHLLAGVPPQGARVLLRPHAVLPPEPLGGVHLRAVRLHHRHIVVALGAAVHPVPLHAKLAAVPSGHVVAVLLAPLGGGGGVLLLDVLPELVHVEGACVPGAAPPLLLLRHGDHLVLRVPVIVTVPCIYADRHFAAGNLKSSCEAVACGGLIRGRGWSCYQL